MIVTKAKLATRARQPNVGMTKKQRQRLERHRAATERDQVRLLVETKTSGSTRPKKQPDAICRDLRPKGGYITKGQKSGPLTKV